MPAWTRWIGTNCPGAIGSPASRRTASRPAWSAIKSVSPSRADTRCGHGPTIGPPGWPFASIRRSGCPSTPRPWPAHPTIREPFVDLLNLGVPTELENQHLAALGYVDVTQGPFRADPTGIQDSTQAVQAAVLFARDHQMACFFPAGSYLISDTLSCNQQLYRRANGRVFGGNRFPNMLVGSRAGAQRPRLMLAPRATGFGNPAEPKIFVHFWSRGYKNPTTADRASDGLPPEVEQPNIARMATSPGSTAIS